MHSSRRSPLLARCRAVHTGRSTRRARWLNHAGSSTRLSCLARLVGLAGFRPARIWASAAD
eukprot:2092346-Prymnesium_polylepis.1